MRFKLATRLKILSDSVEPGDGTKLGVMVVAIFRRRNSRWRKEVASEEELKIVTERKGREVRRRPTDQHIRNRKT
jgi:hypothetical protein